VRIRRTVDGQIIGEGVVRGLSPAIDPIKRTSHLIVDAENAGLEGGDGALRNGLYVDLTIVVRTEKAVVVVPNGAVVTDGPMRFVYVKTKESFAKRDVRTGARDDRVVEIVGGLVPGDVIAVSGAYALSQLRPDVGAEHAGEASR